jgi:uncharacterized membrane protein YkvA (DUF1232 family)
MSNPTPSLPSPQQRNIIQSTILRLRLIWRLIRDPRVHWLLKFIPFGGAVYLLLGPFDLITDIIPVIGLTDDAGILLGSLWLFVEMCPPDVVKEHMDDLTAINVRGTWKEPEQEKLPGESESTKDTKKI